MTHPVQLYCWHFMAYPHLPVDFDEKYDTGWVTVAPGVDEATRAWLDTAILANQPHLGFDRQAPVLTAADYPSIQTDDLAEDEAATRLARALRMDGVEVKPAATGRVNIHARAAGVFTVDRSLIDAINKVDPAITIGTPLQKWAQPDSRFQP